MTLNFSTPPIMAKFNIGDSVVQTATGQRGRIVRVHPARRGRQIYTVNWSDGESDELEVNLSEDCDISDPFERCKGGLWSSYAEFMQMNTTFKIRNSSNNTISSLKASRTLFRAYQFKPLLKFLNSDTRRLLVADEVGLGKTIEAGHIMLEMQARRELRNVLIICPKSLQEKWRAELEEKFDLHFKIYDHKDDLVADLASHRGNIHAIVTYEKIRLPRTSTMDKANRKPSLAEFIEKDSGRFSLVLCDEAHKMRNSDTQTFRGAQKIMSRADAAVFLTATPVMISTENLYNLLNLLDSERFYNYQIFSNLLNQNRPFIESLTALNAGKSFPEILHMLETAEVSEQFSIEDRELFSSTTSISEAMADDPIYQEILILLQGEDTRQVRARLQQLISSMSVMNNIFSRTRKREVTTDMSLAHREPHRIPVTLTDFEQEEFDRVIEEYVDDNSYTNWWGEEVMTQGGALGLVQRKRQIASSVLAYLNTEADLAAGIDRYSDCEDAKVEKLVEIIREVFKSGTRKLVIFGIFRKTLLYLQLRLRRHGYNSLIIHGQVKERTQILQKFKNDPNSHILLSSEVGSEGLDMQFCNSMVNYDLPWNPMVVEQRIGRIDRFGQKSPVVNIYNMVVAGSIQEMIYDRLLDRIGIFKGSIGDMEAILDANFNGPNSGSIQDVYTSLEKELYISKLSQEDQEKRIVEIGVAIEREKIDLQELQQGLDNSLTNDAYFRHEIERILYNRAYVTAQELRNYLESAINQAMPTCTLEPVSEGIYRLRLPQSNRKVLHNFLYQYQPIGDTFTALFSRFEADCDVQEDLTLTFEQHLAYDNPGLIYLNIYHPIVLACFHYLSQKEQESHLTFSYSVQADSKLREMTYGKQHFFLAVYQLTVTRNVMGVQKQTEFQQPILYDLSAGEVVKDTKLTDHLYSLSQSEGKECNPANGIYTADGIEDMRYDMAEAISEHIKARRHEQELQQLSESRRNIQQTSQYYMARIRERERSMEARQSRLEWDTEMPESERRRLENTIHLDQYYINSHRQEMEDKIAAFSIDPQFRIQQKIVSLNLITITY